MSQNEQRSKVAVLVQMVFLRGVIVLVMKHMDRRFSVFTTRTICFLMTAASQSPASPTETR